MHLIISGFKSKSKLFLIALFLTLLFETGCNKKDDIALPNSYTNYYPLASGNYYIYEVDTIKWNSFTQTFDTIRAEIKEVIDSSFLDNKNEKAFKLYQFYRKSSQIDFIDPRLYYTKKTNERAERIDENIRYIKMRFPLEKNKTWNANLFNKNDSFGLSKATVISIHQPYSLGLLNFDSTIKITYFDYTDFLDRKYEEETYAAGVGLIQKYVVDTQFVQFIQEAKVTSGYIYLQRLKEFKVK